MNRIIIGFLVFFVVILSGVAVYLNHSSWKPFRCSTHVNANMTSVDGNILALNLNISTITNNKGIGELLMVGSLKGPNENYAISRRLFISIKNSDFKGFTENVITREERHPIDNIPEKIWQQYILPAAPGATFNVTIKPLRKNLFFIKGLTNPYFVCAMTEN